MPAFERQITINAPVGKVFGYLADFSRHPEWAAHRLEIQQTSEGAVTVGSTFASVGHEMGQHRAKVTISEFVPNSKIVYEADDDTGLFRHYCLFQEEDGQTRLTKGVEPLQLRSLLLRLLTPFIPLMVPRALDGDLQRIKAKLEGGSS